MNSQALTCIAFVICPIIFIVCAALQVVFGSLYRDDVLIKPSRVVSILAAACMLQLVSEFKKKEHLESVCCMNPNGAMCLLIGWLDSAVWRDHEGKHQSKDCVWLLHLC